MKGFWITILVMFLTIAGAVTVLKWPCKYYVVELSGGGFAWEKRCLTWSYRSVFIDTTFGEALARAHRNMDSPGVASWQISE